MNCCKRLKCFFLKERGEKKFVYLLCAKKSFTVKDVPSAAMLLSDAKGVIRFTALVHRLKPTKHTPSMHATTKATSEEREN